jgi:hypothetical protein
MSVANLTYADDDLNKIISVLNDDLTKFYKIGST